jgi:hypothetical protein
VKELKIHTKLDTTEARGKPGNLNALKYGFYSKQFQKGESMDLEEAGDLQEKIGIMRVVTKGLLKMARVRKDMRQLVNPMCKY